MDYRREIEMLQGKEGGEELRRMVILTNYEEKIMEILRQATARERNQQIGGHKA